MDQMFERPRPLRRRSTSPVVLVICLALAGLASASCDRAAAKTHTIGVVNYDSILSPAYDGFKAKMAALGYVEGQTVTYVYHGLLKPDPEAGWRGRPIAQR
jgi:ABC-type sugar transport system substrate-binding protein